MKQSYVRGRSVLRYLSGPTDKAKREAGWKLSWKEINVGMANMGTRLYPMAAALELAACQLHSTPRHRYSNEGCTYHRHEGDDSHTNGTDEIGRSKYQLLVPRARPLGGSLTSRSQRVGYFCEYVHARGWAYHTTYTCKADKTTTYLSRSSAPSKPGGERVLYHRSVPQRGRVPD